MVKIEINIKQLKETIERLPVKERIKLVEQLQRSTWEKQFKQLLSRIDSRLKKRPLSQKEINKIVKQARKEYHARNRR